MTCLYSNTEYSQEGAMEGTQLGVRLVQIPIWDLVAMWPWASHLASPSFHFLIRKMQILPPIPSIVRFK